MAVVVAVAVAVARVGAGVAWEAPLVSMAAMAIASWDNSISH